MGVRGTSELRDGYRARQLYTRVGPVSPRSLRHEMVHFQLRYLNAINEATSFCVGPNGNGG